MNEWKEGRAYCTQRGKFVTGEALEALLPNGDVVAFCPTVIYGEDDTPIDATPHPKMSFSVPCETPLPPYSILRKQSKADVSEKGSQE